MALGSSHLAQRKADWTLPLRKLLAHPPRQQKVREKCRSESCGAAPAVLAKLLAEGNGHDFYITRSAVTGNMLVYCAACDAYGADAPNNCAALVLVSLLATVSGAVLPFGPRPRHPFTGEALEPPLKAPRQGVLAATIPGSPAAAASQVPGPLQAAQALLARPRARLQWSTSHWLFTRTLSLM